MAQAMSVFQKWLTIFRVGLTAVAQHLRLLVKDGVEGRGGAHGLVDLDGIRLVVPSDVHRRALRDNSITLLALGETSQANHNAGTSHPVPQTAIIAKESVFLRSPGANYPRVDDKFESLEGFWDRKVSRNA